MKMLHISDTHGYHHLLIIPKDIDMIIHSGDFSNHYHPVVNLPEAISFLEWYSKINVKHKLLIAGNHDATPANNKFLFKEMCAEKGIIYLENETVEIDGIKIFGSPVTPTFGNWHFMRARHKMEEFWRIIPEDTDILVVHGPPKGILDLSYNREGVLEYCGCKSLRNRILNQLNLKFCLFGHIHNFEDILNAGVTKLAVKDTVFSNGSVVTDRKFGILTSNGNILNYEF